MPPLQTELEPGAGGRGEGGGEGGGSSFLYMKSWFIKAQAEEGHLLGYWVWLQEYFTRSTCTISRLTESVSLREGGEI